MQNFNISYCTTASTFLNQYNCTSYHGHSKKNNLLLVRLPTLAFHFPTKLKRGTLLLECLLSEPYHVSCRPGHRSRHPWLPHMHISRKEKKWPPILHLPWPRHMEGDNEVGGDDVDWCCAHAAAAAAAAAHTHCYTGVHSCMIKPLHCTAYQQGRSNERDSCFWQYPSQLSSDWLVHQVVHEFIREASSYMNLIKEIQILKQTKYIYAAS